MNQSSYQTNQSPSHKVLDQHQNKQCKFASPKRIDTSQYDKIRVVGKGAFGIATVCRKRPDCSLVVLKEIDLKKLPTQRERLFAINEANIMSMIDHINIIRYYNTYQFDFKLIIEMEYANHGTLSNYLSFQNQMLEEQEILIIFKQITIGLDYLHSKNIIHQDLKTANIFLSADGIVKIGDFGIARLLPSTSCSIPIRTYQATVDASKMAPQALQEDNYPDKNPLRVNPLNHSQQTYNGVQINHQVSINQLYASYAGTPAYCSPEKCLGEPIDKKSDIWSLGCILYELVTLRQTFEGSNLPAMINKITKVQYTPIKRNLSQSLRTILEQMLTKDPIRRPHASEIVSFTGQLLYKIQLDRYRINNLRSNYRLDISTVVAALAANDRDEIDQIRCPHSLVYQVRLDQEHITANRLNLPKTKRFKEISKGSNHYLALTYDNIVYGWGDRTKGQLGSCGLPSSKKWSSSKDGLPASVKGGQLKQPAFIGLTAGGNNESPLPKKVDGVNESNNNDVMNNNNNPLKNAISAIRPFILNELNGRKITQIATGHEFSIFLSKTGLVLSCGSGSRGCLGHGNYENCYTPMLVKSLLHTDVVSVSCGIEHVVAVCGDGRALAWGCNKDGRLGIEEIGSESAYINAPQCVKIPQDVFIKRAICGENSTIFIDSDSNCWACGKNTYNKLGLDMRRKFKGNDIVNKQLMPTKLTSLGTKQKPVSCSIGQNHSGFLLDDGKLIIMGKDIDLRYKTYKKHKKGGYFHPRTTGSLLAASLNPGEVGSKSNFGCKSVIDSRIRISQSSSRSTLVSNNTVERAAERLNKIQSMSSITNITRKQKRTYKEYIKKSRSIKKILNSSVVKVSCTSKFTLALTSDNRVYFWGTRSHHYQPTTLAAYNSRLLQQQKQNNLSLKKDEIRNSVLSLSSSRNGDNMIAKNKPIETQLVASCADDCLMKIGATNDSLMATIEKIGSDQPIIHVQDPKLVADSFQDLWILDYNCDDDDDDYDDNDDDDGEEGDVDGNSHDRRFSICSPEIVRAEDIFEQNSPGYDGNKKRHDVILKPQPIIGLYVPSMFKQNGHTICMSDIFCSDDDRFFIIFDTTVLPQPQQQQQHYLPRSPNKYDNVPDSHKHQTSNNAPKSSVFRRDNQQNQQQKPTNKNETIKNEPRQVIVSTPVKDNSNIISDSASSPSSSSSPTTTMLLNKNIEQKETQSHDNYREKYSNSVISIKNPHVRQTDSLNVDTNTDRDVEYQQASFEMDVDDDDTMMLKSDAILVNYSSRSSSMSKTGSTTMSSLTSRPNSPPSDLSDNINNVGSDPTISSVNTTDNTIVSTDDNQFQSLAYEEPFSLSNIANMTSTRYEFIKSASSASDFTIPSLHTPLQSQNNISRINGSVDGNNHHTNNLADIYSASSMSNNNNSLILGQNSQTTSAAKLTTFHSQRNRQQQQYRYITNQCNNYYQELGGNGNHILQRRRPRRRTTTNSSIIDIEEASDNYMTGKIDTGTYFDEDDIVDEDSIPDWVRKELDQVQQNIIGTDSFAENENEICFCGGENRSLNQTSSNHPPCDENGQKQSHVVDRIMEKNTNSMKGNMIKDLPEELSLSSTNSTLIDLTGQQNKNHKIVKRKNCGNRAFDQPPIVVPSYIPDGSATDSIYLPIPKEGLARMYRHERCYSLPSLTYNTKGFQEVTDRGSANSLSIRYLQEENRSLSRELIETKCMLSKCHKTINFMSQQIETQNKRPSVVNGEHCQNLSQSTRDVLDNRTCSQDDAGKPRSQFSGSLLSFRRSMIKLFC